MGYTKKKYMDYKSSMSNNCSMDCNCNSCYNNNGCRTSNQNHQDCPSDNDQQLSYAGIHHQMNYCNSDIDHIGYIDQPGWQYILVLQASNKHHPGFEMTGKKWSRKLKTQQQRTGK